ncbi:hypothetical protein [Alcanivorax jadensis]|uniref:hypothetical protein n=1 Tax=Alcanivorax jadensis TaxID=64988 RepID=UPI0026EF9CA1|nr:hypothetical protein [Alcanivorax jadensis]
MTIPHVAFRSSDTLHQKTDGFIRRMQGGATRPEPQEIEAIMGIFIDEALTALITRAAEAAQLSPGLMKVVRMTTQTINKATLMVVSRSAKKLDLQQNRDAAYYMDQVRQPAPGGDFWYVAFPVDEEMAALGKSLPDLCDDNPEKARKELVRYLLALTDQAIEWYFERPMALLQFGPELRKLASMGVETTRKASRSLINNLVPKLNAEQLKASAEFQASQLVPLPPRSA